MALDETLFTFLRSVAVGAGMVLTVLIGVKLRMPRRSQPMARRSKQ